MHNAQKGVELKRSLPSHNHAKGIGEFQLTSHGRAFAERHTSSPLLKVQVLALSIPLPPIHRKNASQLIQHGQDLIT
jgi:hypothetical protein